MTEIRNMLDEAIKAEIENLNALETGSEEKAKAVGTLATLHKLRIEEIDRDHDEAFKHRQFTDGIVDRYVKLGVAVAELVLPLAFYGIWMKMGFEFEKEGTFTSSTFKNLFNRFKPTRKG